MKEQGYKQLIVYSIVILVIMGSVNNNKINGLQDNDLKDSLSVLPYNEDSILSLINGSNICEFTYTGEPSIEEMDANENGIKDTLLYTQEIAVTNPGVLTATTFGAKIVKYNSSEIYDQSSNYCPDIFFYLLPENGLYNFSVTIDGSRFNSTMRGWYDGKIVNFINMNVTFELILSPYHFNGTGPFPEYPSQKINKTINIQDPTSWERTGYRSEIISPIQNNMKKINGENRSIGELYSWSTYMWDSLFGKQNISFDMELVSIKNDYCLVNTTAINNDTITYSTNYPIGVGFTNSRFMPSYLISKSAPIKLVSEYMIEKMIEIIAYSYQLNVSTFDLEIKKIDEYMSINLSCSGLYESEYESFTWDMSYSLVYYLTDGLLVSWGLKHYDGVTGSAQIINPNLKIPEQDESTGMTSIETEDTTITEENTSKIEGTTTTTNESEEKEVPKPTPGFTIILLMIILMIGSRRRK